MSTDTHIPADNPMDATLTELKGEKPEHDSGSGRFKPKGGRGHRRTEKEDRPLCPEKEDRPHLDA